MDENKTSKFIFSILIVLTGIFLLFALIFGGLFFIKKSGTEPLEANRDFWDDKPGYISWLKYVVGPAANLTDSPFEYSGIVVTIAMFLLVLVTFSDIIGTFSSFRPGISWVIGFCFAVIAAQLGWTLQMLLLMSGLFLRLASAAVFIGLLGAFVAFLFVNWGLIEFKQWIKNRATMIKASEEGAHLDASWSLVQKSRVGELKAAKAMAKTSKKSEKTDWPLPPEQ